MKWIRERDALIAQTLAFVQSVTGRKDDLRRPDGDEAAPDTTVDVASILAIGQTVDSGPSPRQTAAQADGAQPFRVAPPRASGDFRSEVLARVANFRKHQERFEREREEYCAATMAKLRADIRDVPAKPAAGK
jgi:hypothetical protein